MNIPVRGAAARGTVERRVPKIAYVLDPRFPGGTSTAVARELETIWANYRPKIYGISSRMFAGQTIAPPLAQTLHKIGADLVWDPKTIEADIVIIHNPSFLKFQDRLACNIVAQRIYVVTHENFTRPGGALGFDVAGCLGQIDRASTALEKILAPVSPHNRNTVQDWLEQVTGYGVWDVLSENWFNICDFTMEKPTENPRDRRGRLSRPGFEKFPSLTALEQCFSKNAQSNIILGADTLMAHQQSHPHWTLIPFNGVEVGAFFEDIDFMVYFTSPSLRESFGRALVEAIGAGKVVITDAETASTIGEGVVVSRPDEVDTVISNLIENPGEYVYQVQQAQKTLAAFSTIRFLQMYETIVTWTEETSR